MVRLDSGYCAKGQGMDATGFPVFNCYKVDYTADGATVYNNTYCQGAVKHNVRIGYSTAP